MKNKKIKLMIFLIIIFLLLDQLSKILAINFNNLKLGFIQIENVYNDGIAFGMNSGNLSNAILVFLVICIIINFVYNQKEKLDNKTAIALSMVISGGIGNLIDRIFRGGVFDFIKIWNFPVFNLADCFIVVGWILLIWNLIVFFIKDMQDIKSKNINTY